MILLVHLLVGATVGSIVKNIPLAIILAFLSHYFLDLLPHVEYAVENIVNKNWKKSTPDFIKISLDFILGFMLIFLFSKNELIIYICAVSAILPDALNLLNLYFTNKVVETYRELHQKKIHFLKYKKTKAPNELGARPNAKDLIFGVLVSTPFKISTQIAVVIISIILIRL